jgi:hypothetical protein
MKCGGFVFENERRVRAGRWGVPMCCICTIDAHNARVKKRSVWSMLRCFVYISDVALFQIFLVQLVRSSDGCGGSRGSTCLLSRKPVVPL